MGLDWTSALKVGISENLLYGLVFLPLWFGDKAVGWMRIALWFTRLSTAICLGFIFALSFRQDSIQEHAICNCVQENEFLFMEYSDPPAMQPTCATMNAQYQWALCDITDRGSPEDYGSGPSPPSRPRAPPPDLPTMRTTSPLTCWPSTPTCCRSYLNARVIAGKSLLKAAYHDFNARLETLSWDNNLLSARRKIACNLTVRSWQLEAFFLQFLRWLLFEPIVDVIGNGKFCFKKCPKLLRLLFLVPWLIYLFWFFMNFWNINEALRTVLGVTTAKVGAVSSFFTSLLTSLLFLDLVKATLWAKFMKSERDLDIHGLPIIEETQERRRTQA